MYINALFFRLQKNINNDKRLQEAKVLVNDMIQSTPSLISGNPKSKVLTKRLSHSSSTIDNKRVTHDTNKSRRVISSVDGLSHREQSKMAEILVRK